MAPTLTYLLGISALLFCIGLAIVITKKNTLFIVIGIELMLNAANFNFILFNSNDGMLLQGVLFVLFSIILSVCEMAIVLALLIKV